MNLQIVRTDMYINTAAPRCDVSKIVFPEVRFTFNTSF